MVPHPRYIALFLLGVVCPFLPVAARVPDLHSPPESSASLVDFRIAVSALRLSIERRDLESLQQQVVFLRERRAGTLAADELCKYAGSFNPFVREFVPKGLALLQDDARCGIPILARLVTDEEEDVCCAALEALPPDQAVLAIAIEASLVMSRTGPR